MSNDEMAKEARLSNLSIDIRASSFNIPGGRSHSQQPANQLSPFCFELSNCRGFVVFNLKHLIQTCDDKDLVNLWPQ
jgi:hypothetical protein